MRILYIEDDATNLALIERIAHSGKHQVLNYDAAEDALANIQQDGPDLVLIDLVLAGDMHGLDLVRAMRAGGFVKPITSSDTYCLQQRSYSIVRVC